MLSSSQSEILILNRRRRLLQGVAITALLVASLSLGYAIFNLFKSLNSSRVSLSVISSLITSSTTVVISAITLLLSRRETPGPIRVGSYLMTGSWALIIFASLLIGNYNSTTLAALMIPMVCAGLLFDAKEVLLWLAGLAGLIIVGFILFITDIIPSPPTGNTSDATLTTNFICYMILLIIIGGSFWFLQINIRTTLMEVNSQVQELARLGYDKERKRKFGEQVSIQLKSMTAELTSTTLQQTSRSHQQASAVMEITTSLNELGETARQIASNARQVSEAAADGISSAQTVRATSQRANSTAERGQAAVSSSIIAIEEVRTDITALAERLMTLAERSRHIGSIIALIKEISDETHLLALNAAIESAGAGEHGQRFGVVAAEVKNLADRSLSATLEVSQIINELQGAVAGTVLASEETRKKTFGAVERGYQAGQVINELGQVVDETTLNSRQIAEVVQQVAVLAEEIRLATQQQESAIQQVVSTMEGVGIVAKENASAVAQVSETISQIDDLSLQLKETLNTANQAKDESAILQLASLPV